MSSRMKILIIQGPNLNLLGTREPHLYGAKNNEDLMNDLKLEFSELEFSYFQSNIEGEIINRIHSASSEFDGIVLNAAAYTHTSIAIADAIAAVEVPVVEVHISNLHKRESFRQKSLIGAYCLGSISGFGLKGYSLAVSAIKYSRLS